MLYRRINRKTKPKKVTESACLFGDLIGVRPYPGAFRFLVFVLPDT